MCDVPGSIGVEASRSSARRAENDTAVFAARFRLSHKTRLDPLGANPAITALESIWAQPGSLFTHSADAMARAVMTSQPALLRDKNFYFSNNHARNCPCIYL